MKFMLMMTCPKNGYESFGSMPPEAIREHIQFQKRFDESLRKSGELLSAEGLADPREAVIVRAGKDRRPVIDMVLAETKEFLAGYWIVEVPNAERAYEIAAQASAAPGVGGEPMNIPIQVRQIMAGPPQEFL